MGYGELQSRKRYWNYKRKTKNDEELKMTRSERAKTNAQKIKEQKRKAILSMVTGVLAKEYKKEDGSWNVYKLAKDLGMSRNTIYKHLRELQEEGKIP